jgi:hypothetical protein
MRPILLRKLLRPSGEPIDFRLGSFLRALLKWLALYLVFAFPVMAVLSLLLASIKVGALEVLNPVLVGFAWWVAFKNYRNPICLWLGTVGVMFVLTTAWCSFLALRGARGAVTGEFAANLSLSEWALGGGLVVLACKRAIRRTPTDAEEKGRTSDGDAIGLPTEEGAPRPSR